MKIHDKCELPVELCVCDGDDDPKAIYDLECGLCGFDYIGVIPPGFLFEQCICPNCQIKGFIKAMEPIVR